MSEPSGTRNKKGSFSAQRLPLAKRYVEPPSRRAMFLLGGLGLLTIGVVFVFNVTVQRGGLISNGPLSSNHATLETDCETCHTPFGEVSDDRCGVCHEKHGDETGIHTFAAHYLYRSTDTTRLALSTPVRDRETPCFACHTEHVGRWAMISDVADAQCLPCHAYGSFNEHHPAFKPSNEARADEANLTFPHTLHVREVMDSEDETGVDNACLVCHRPEADGKNFQPLDFDQHCAECHDLDGTPNLRLAPAGNASSGTPGVLSLERILAQQAPCTTWADAMHPSVFQQSGVLVRKRRVTHKDPWIRYNLDRIRQTLYPAAEPTDSISAADVNLALSPTQVRAYRRLSSLLADPCQSCHVIDEAALLPVQADQDVLTRAVFDHRAHVIQQGCLDCHTAIPIRASLADDTDPPPSLDQSGIVNIPEIDVCQRCHAADQAANTCIMCHLFHPDQSHWSTWRSKVR